MKDSIESKNNENLAPIVLFVYNRLYHTQKTIQSLQNNLLSKDSDLYIYSDGPKEEFNFDQVKKVRDFLKTIKGFKSVKIIERDKNWGLAANIIDGVTEVVNQYGSIIVLEDDLVCSKFFLKYMNESLILFKESENIGSITAFNFPLVFTKFKKTDGVFLNIRPMSWSWGTWSNIWNDVDWSQESIHNFLSKKNNLKKIDTGGKDLKHMLKMQLNNNINSWYIKFCKHLIVNDLFTVYPIVSLVNNIGHDGTGVHCGKNEKSLFSHKELNNKHVDLTQQIILDYKKIKIFNTGFESKLFSLKLLIKTIIGNKIYEYIKKSIK